MIPRNTNVASSLCWFPGFNLWSSWNVMATLLFVVSKRTEGPLFLRREKHWSINAIHCDLWPTNKQIYCKGIQIYTILGTHLMKDSSRESNGNYRAENDFVKSNIFGWNISPKPQLFSYVFSYFTTFTVQYFHTEFT